MLKKILHTVILGLAVNGILFLAHIIAIFGLAFNDSSAEFPSVLHLLPNLIFCIGPLAVASFFLIRLLAKKYEFYVPVLYAVQGLLVVFYVLVYIHSYVPTSLVRTVTDSVKESRAERKQRNMDEEAQECLCDRYVDVYDEIESEEESITIYFCYDSDKVIFQYSDDNGEQTHYCVAEEVYRAGKVPDGVVKYTNQETGNTVVKENNGRVYLSVRDGRYLCLDSRDLVVYCGERKNLGFLYFELLNRDVMENNFRYIPNDIVVLEIEENDMVCSITEESLRRLNVMDENEQFSYGWTILRNGQQILSRVIHIGEYTLNLRELPVELWAQAGDYEIYLHTYFHSDLLGTEYNGYIKASNSAFWKMSEK